MSPLNDGFEIHKILDRLTDDPKLNADKLRWLDSSMTIKPTYFQSVRFSPLGHSASFYGSNYADSGLGNDDG